MRWLLAHPGRAAEAILALGLCLLIFAAPSLRGLFFIELRAFGAGARSFFALLPDDFGGTLRGGLATLAGAALVLVPATRFALSFSRARRVWWPLYFTSSFLALPMTFPAFSTVPMWILGAIAALAGTILASKKRRVPFRLFALLPQLLALEPLTGHGPLGDLVWPASRIAHRCNDNDGYHLAGLADDERSTRFFGLTPASDGSFLLSGERASFWLRREGPGLTVDTRSALRGNFWQGCALDGRLWLTKRGRLVELKRYSASEALTTYPLADPDGAVELDLVDAICDPTAHAIYVSELLGGGLRIFSLDGGATSRRPLGAGANLQLARGNDGLLAAIDTARLYRYDPKSDRLLSDRAAGIAALGVDLCPTDGEVAVADLAGRIRLFHLETDGSYRFDRGASLRTPRRVAWSPDCKFLAVTSGDDRTVSILARDTLATVRSWRAGPGLRDLTYIAPSEVAIADACGATVLPAAD